MNILYGFVSDCEQVVAFFALFDVHFVEVLVQVEAEVILVYTDVFESLELELGVV